MLDKILFLPCPLLLCLIEIYLSIKPQSARLCFLVQVFSGNGIMGNCFKSLILFLGTQVRASAINGLQRSKSSLESLFCYDKSVPEEDIGKPTGLNVEKKNIGDNPPCTSCEAKGAVLCETCAGSGLYVDSILESQGIIVKVRCLGKQDRKHFVQQLWSCYIAIQVMHVLILQVTVGCGGTGNIMCSKCGGRGHT